MRLTMCECSSALPQTRVPFCSSVVHCTCRFSFRAFPFIVMAPATSVHLDHAISVCHLNTLHNLSSLHNIRINPPALTMQAKFHNSSLTAHPRAIPTPPLHMILLSRLRHLLQHPLATPEARPASITPASLQLSKFCRHTLTLLAHRNSCAARHDDVAIEGVTLLRVLSDATPFAHELRRSIVWMSLASP